MPRRTTRTTARTGTRHGTATRRAGRETAARLVEAAHALLETESYEKFSMRNVAEQAGVSLANLQYYFPHREDLARALYLDVAARYEAAYRSCLEAAPADPLARFKIVLRWNMQDITRKSTRRFFMQLWALLGSLDDFEGHYLGELYAADISQLGEHIGAVNPLLGSEEVARRATLIAALIEGLMVVTGGLADTSRKRASICDAAFETALSIASGD